MLGSFFATLGVEVKQKEPGDLHQNPHSNLPLITPTTTKYKLFGISTIEVDVLTFTLTPPELPTPAVFEFASFDKPNNNIHDIFPEIKDCEEFVGVVLHNVSITKQNYKIDNSKDIGKWDRDISACDVGLGFYALIFWPSAWSEHGNSRDILNNLR